MESRTSTVRSVDQIRILIYNIYIHVRLIYNPSPKLSTQLTSPATSLVHQQIILYPFRLPPSSSVSISSPLQPVSGIHRLSLGRGDIWWENVLPQSTRAERHSTHSHWHSTWKFHIQYGSSPIRCFDWRCQTHSSSSAVNCPAAACECHAY